MAMLQKRQERGGGDDGDASLCKPNDGAMARTAQPVVARFTVRKSYTPTLRMYTGGLHIIYSEQVGVVIVRAIVRHRSTITILQFTSYW
jgi:hypothetical protein